ncbi:F-box only protein 7 [Eumeta japonica]|uniref:F-box only protein 7 n=1 Tax=Eumeta variegata TaxID=151549 RepID=A0A4C1TZC9_EUMVA|nr:F-box only protein 7 [Eumeta japonica]
MNVLEENEDYSKISPILLEQLMYETNLIGGCEKQELLFALILVIIIESNFTLLNRDLDIVNNIAERILSARESKDGNFIATFVWDKFVATPLRVVAILTGDVMILNAVLFDLNNETYSLCLPIPHYVSSSEPIKLRELRNLILRIKDGILTPIKCSILNHYGLSSACLKGLPEELLLNISLNLPVRDVVNLGKTCRRLHSILNDENFWCRLCKRDFKGDKFDNRSDWKELYKDKFILNLEESKKRQRIHMFGTMHEFMDFSDYVSYVDPGWETFT